MTDISDREERLTERPAQAVSRIRAAGDYHRRRELLQEIREMRGRRFAEAVDAMFRARSKA